MRRLILSAIVVAALLLSVIGNVSLLALRSVDQAKLAAADATIETLGLRLSTAEDHGGELEQMRSRLGSERRTNRALQARLDELEEEASKAEDVSPIAVLDRYSSDRERARAVAEMIAAAGGSCDRGEDELPICEFMPGLPNQDGTSSATAPPEAESSSEAVSEEDSELTPLFDGSGPDLLDWLSEEEKTQLMMENEVLCEEGSCFILDW